jgi:hypothetical protein
MALSGKIAFNADLLESGTVDLGVASYEAHVPYEWVVTNGTAVNQADKLWVDANRTLAASAADSIDIAGVLTSAFGVSLTLVKLKGLFITTSAGNPDNLSVSRVASGVPLFVAATDALVIPPGGMFAWATKAATAVAITPGTGDLITVTAAATAGTYTYTIAVVGTGA